jgi:type IV pilus assembly protein PilB
MQKLPVGELLRKLGYVTEEQVRVALEVRKISPRLMGEILTELSFVSPAETARAIARQAGREYIDIDTLTPAPEALALFDRQTAAQAGFLPLNITGAKIEVALSDPYNLNTLDIVRRKTGLQPEVYVADSRGIRKAIEIGYYLLEKPIDEEIRSHAEKALDREGGSDIPMLIELIINNAVISRATDIHFSPEESATHIFFRIDGIMHHSFALHSRLHNAIISRIKILSKLDIAEQRRPQDGSLVHKFFDDEFDIRISTIPTPYGENAVMRLLSKNLSLFNLESLGFERDIQNRMISGFGKSHGIFLVTGPTGSGKTTTLYAALRKIDSLKRRVLTVENPIEYRFPFIKQTEVNEKAGYTFASAMRAFLRQDPDVILLGEMRDEETAEMAMRAAITGHLVLSTLHTNDAVTAIPRMLDMKVKDYLISSGVSGIAAQRLVRQTCPRCAATKTVSAAELTGMGFSEAMLKKHGIDGKIDIKAGTGCPLCRNSGYSGRTVIAELLEMDEETGEMIIKGSTPQAIARRAAEKGMKTLKEDGLIKIIKGVTTPEEVIRVCG